MSEDTVCAKNQELNAERERLQVIVNADLAGKLNREWLIMQEPMFTIGQPAAFYDEWQARLDGIWIQRDAAWAEQLAAMLRISEISELQRGPLTSFAAGI